MKQLFLWCSCLALIASIESVSGQNWEHTIEDQKLAIDSDSVTEKGYTLIWISKDSTFSDSLKCRLIEAYFENYPNLVETFNPNSRKTVSFVIDPSYNGVAATAGGIVRFNPGWFAENPNDIDVVTHEIMHIVQDYPSGSGPWWITEGIADYIRFVYGLANDHADWALPDFNAEQYYTDSYRITARFFHWLVIHHNDQLVLKLDAVMRTGNYTPEFWSEQTGKSIDELWKAYAKNPTL